MHFELVNFSTNASTSEIQERIKDLDLDIERLAHKSVKEIVADHYDEIARLESAKNRLAKRLQA